MREASQLSPLRCSRHALFSTEAEYATSKWTLEERVTSLERELRKVKTELQSVKKASQKPWWGHVAGRFKNDPLFDETIRAGQKYRRSLKPRTR